MLNIIKYEWLRRWKFFLAGSVVFIIANLFITGQVSRATDTAVISIPNILASILSTLLFAFALALFFDHVGRLYRSLYTDEGLLDFTLPLNGYQFLGGKLLTIFLECIGLIIFAGLAAYLNLAYLAKIMMGEELAFLLAQMPGVIPRFLTIITLLLVGYMGWLLILYLSLTLAKTIFAAIKYGKLVAFLSFLVVVRLIGFIFDFLHTFVNFATNPQGDILNISDWFILITIVIILFASTGFLLDRKLNL